MSTVSSAVGDVKSDEDPVGGADRAPTADERQSTAFSFAVLSNDAGTHARRGIVTTRRGTVQTPAFMPVGTQATVKTLLPREVRATGAEILLCNTYHLMLRPGLETLKAADGL